MPKTVRAVHANRGIEAAYRKAIQSMVDDMARSAEYWLRAAYNAKPPVVLAQDRRVGEGAKERQQFASVSGPVANIKRVMGDLQMRWISHFDEWAPKIAESYVTKMFKASDSSFRQALKDSGWSVEFKMTPAVRQAFNASLAENVGLIKSIPQEYLQQVEGVVMRSYANGRDLETMVKDLKALYPKASDRAVLIARDQSNKANAVTNRTRQMELGIVEAVWMHSNGGKTPRPDHVAASGKRYKIAEGCKISGEFIQPGQEINCRCTSRAILPF